MLIGSKEFVDLEPAVERRRAIRPLVHSIEAMDRWGMRVRRRWRRAAAARAGGTWRPGISIVIPERDNPQELTACLASLEAATREWTEPLETIVVVNGSPEAIYQALRKAYPKIRWQSHARPLGFAGAVRAGLRAVRHDWVYLLNNDVALDPLALRALAPHRASETFAIASQIFFKDTTRYREETNWSTLLVESGLATIHDWIPRSDASVPTFYAGGGASLFQTRLLRSVLDVSAYHPFYWEDVEWGWRTRKLGYDSWFCPGSVAHHTQRSTIGRHYSPAEVERIIRRNGFLFQLRNLTSAGSLQRVIDEIARAPEAMTEYFLAASTRWSIARGRFWNYRAPFTDEEVFAQWNSSISNC